MIRLTLKERSDCVKNADLLYVRDLNENGLGEIDDLDLYALKQVDRARYLGGKFGAIETPFGICSILNASSGCKVVLYYLRYRKSCHDFLCLDVTLCGANALEALFSCVDSLHDDNVLFYLGHASCLSFCTARDYDVDGYKARSVVEGLMHAGV